MRQMLLAGLLAALPLAAFAQTRSPGELVPFKPSAPTDTAPQPCAFPNVKLPQDYRILATGAYNGRKLDWQIDQSGHEATQIDVAVNHAAQPVVLFLGAYEPTVWNVGWTKETRILAVVVSGYHRQAVAGLDPRVPTINSSYDNRGDCGYFYLGGSENGLEKLNPLARRLFGRPVDLVYPAGRNGVAMVGERTDAGLLTHPARTPESFRDPNAPLAGRAGLEAALRSGEIRRATESDAQAWLEAAAQAGQRDVPPVDGKMERERDPQIMMGRAYVVLKPFTYPAGLYGGNLAVFYIAKGVPRPSGNPGHSAIYDLNTGSCDGPMCRAGR